MNVAPWTTDSGLNPLSRRAGSAFKIGRFVFLLNGFIGDDKKSTYTFECSGVLRYDLITHLTKEILPPFDFASFQRHFFSPAEFCLSSAAVAHKVLPNKQCLVYVFGGYSLKVGCYVNALQRFVLNIEDTQCLSSSESVSHEDPCWQVVSGHGFFGRAVMRDDLLNVAFHLALKISVDCGETGGVNSSIARRFDKIPSPRDKSTMEYFNDKLYIFGGFGVSPSPPNSWPLTAFDWPFLHAADDPEEWYLFEGQHGWHRQLLIFDIPRQSWSLWRHAEHGGHAGPSPRAAHTSSMDHARGHMFIFGGRSYADRDQFDRPLTRGRTCDLYLFNMHTLQWSELVGSSRDLWPQGRSWATLNVLPDQGRSDRHTTELFVYGGQTNEALSSDTAFRLRVDLDSLSASVVATNRPHLAENKLVTFAHPAFNFFRTTINSNSKHRTQFFPSFIQLPQAYGPCREKFAQLLLNVVSKGCVTLQSVNGFDLQPPFTALATVLALLVREFRRLLKVDLLAEEELKRQLQRLTLCTDDLDNSAYSVSEFFWQLAALMTPWDFVMMHVAEANDWLRTPTLQRIWDRVNEDKMVPYSAQMFTILASFREQLTVEYSCQWCMQLCDRMRLLMHGAIDWIEAMLERSEAKEVVPLKLNFIRMRTPVARSWHSAVVLPDSSVLVIGGQLRSSAFAMDLIIDKGVVPTLRCLAEKCVVEMVTKRLLAFHRRESSSWRAQNSSPAEDLATRYISRVHTSLFQNLPDNLYSSLTQWL